MRLPLFLLLVVGPALLSSLEVVRAGSRARTLLIPVELIVIAASLVVWEGLSRHLEVRRLTRRRMLDPATEDAPDPPPADPEEGGFLVRWLALAGYRAAGSAGRFVALTAAMIAAGVATALVFRGSGLLATGLRALERLPGAIGEIFWVPLVLGPWIIMAVMACLPWLVVRASRRRIATEVERDLPLVLELLATLGESGLGFDAALARVVASQPPDRPLTAEFRTFQRETLTGRPRVEALRRLARRLDVTSLSIFVSAVVQAEQIGSGVSDVLRRQAEDVRDRRRDRALNLAQALPVKLLFPLVICFLPGIFVVTLGPILLQFIRFAEAMLDKGDAAMKTAWALVDPATGRVVVARLAIAAGYWSRLVGLQGRARPPSGFGLLLVPCASIHTCFLRFAVDVVLLDRAGQVVAVRRGMRPWRFVLPARHIHAILEVPAGDAAAIQPGQFVRLTRTEGGATDRPPRRLLSWVQS